MKIKTVKIEEAIPYIRNPRQNKAAIAKVSASLKEFGWQQPIVVDKDMVVIAGHTRLEAARTLGMDKVPVQIAEDLTDAQVKAYRIADNRVSQEAEWDLDLLRLELSDLDNLDYNLMLTGFDDDELNGMLTEAVESFTDEDDVPELPDEPVSVIGDIWTLGNHRLMCGDSTSIDAIEKLVNGKVVDCVYTDPPYGMFLDANYDAMFESDKSHRKTGKRFMKVAGDHDDFKPEFINTIFKAFDYVDEIFIWGADYFSELIPNRKEGSWVVWDKRTNQEMDKVTGNTFELCWSKKKHKRLIARILWSGYHGMYKDGWKKKRVHPTQKPVELVKWFFDNWSKPKDSVVDLFGGSGSTLIACQQTNRIAYLMELDEKYVDVIINRWQDFTGKEAVHAETGKTYNEMKAERNGGK